VAELEFLAEDPLVPQPVFSVANRSISMSYEATGKRIAAAHRRGRFLAHHRRLPSCPQRVIKRTRTCGVWAAPALSALVLVLLLIFVLENGQRVNIGYFGFHGHLALGVALLFAATRRRSCW
jgi:uncharacterized integral membrane protein